MFNNNNNSLVGNKKLSIRKKRELQANQAKLARLLKSNVLYKLRNIQGFTFNR